MERQFHLGHHPQLLFQEHEHPLGEQHGVERRGGLDGLRAQSHADGASGQPQVVTKIVEKIVRVPVPVPVPVAGGGGMGDFRYWERTTALHDVFPRPTDTSQEKFVSFEPWNGGFNNIRQSLEIAAAFAFATNRTLVFPPAWNMYLRGKSGLEDYFHLKDIVKGLPVIMYSDFHKLIGWKRPGDSQQSATGQPGMGECPKMGQTQQLVQRVAVPINGGHSWTSASEFCAARGAALCCAADICDHESGVPFQEFEEDDSWAPVRDDLNDWLQIGPDVHAGPRTCQTHMGLYSSGPGWGADPHASGSLKNHIICCKYPPKAKSSLRRRSLNAVAADADAAVAAVTDEQAEERQRRSSSVALLAASPREGGVRGGGGGARRRLLGQTEDYVRYYGGIEFDQSVLLIGMAKGDPWYTDIFCIPECPTTGPLKERFEKFNTGGARGPLKMGQRTPKWHSYADAKYADARIIHFRQNLLGQFYQQLWFADPLLEVATKRFVRDFIHFSDPVIEPAQNVIKALGDKAFSCIHVRRGDFQYHDTREDMLTILKNTQGLFLPGERLYIATDERSKKYFEPAIKAGWNLTFWDDFSALTKNTKGFIIPCSEMSVCSRARIFVGTKLSTFSGYIQRMRGYMTDQPHKEVYDTQTVFPSGYAPSWSEIWDHPTCGWCREFKESWEGL